MHEDNNLDVEYNAENTFSRSEKIAIKLLKIILISLALFVFTKITGKIGTNFDIYSFLSHKFQGKLEESDIYLSLIEDDVSY